MKQFNRLIDHASGLRLLVCSIVVICFTSGSAVAEKPNNKTSQQSSRDKLYDQLAKDTKEIERFAGALKKVVVLAKPTVVHIQAVKQSDGRTVEEAGSGVIIQRKGKFYVITNRHVIKDTDNENIKIKLDDGEEMYPSRVWDDADTDIAIMRVNPKKIKLIPARLGNSNKTDIGDFVLAIGSPFGLSHSVTFGIISAKGRHDLELGTEDVQIQDFLQIDAAINPGNSGGPLFNLRGEVIGINTAIASNSGGNNGIGFTIPIQMVILVTDQLLEYGEVRRAFLGVNLDRHYTAARARQRNLPFGALVRGITPKSPAETAHFKNGDVVIYFNGKRIDNDNHLVSQVSLTPIGKEVPVIVYREGKKIQIKVTVGNRKKFQVEK